ncbi:hypothetical protein Bca4012_088654 [Brassica carinata]|uniref:Uncharacterized protein n=1 Tax=Brassica carinata TaxID=52824 RepID=A0A8X7PCG4_BRACI|nr:hypothetical protein Bca52824_087740 [Brassica carinata]
MMMKTAGGAITIFGLMISFFLCAITASGFVSGEKEIVLDTIGRPVEFYAPYHAYFERPGANALICRYGSIETSGFSCPQRVLKIHFQFPNHCEESGYWRVADSSLPIREIVLTGSKSSNDTTFTIKKSDVSYQFAFGSADKPTDIDSLDSGIQRLILSNDYAFDIHFVPL